MKNYSITLLEYAKATHFPNAMVYSGFYGVEGTTAITYMIAVLQSGDDVILIDSGYDPAEPEALAHMQQEAHENFKSPVEVLKKIGISADQVKHVIITHAHWDHMGGIHYFPNATFYLQKEELIRWIETLALPQPYDILKSATKYADIEKCVGLLKERRLVLLDGDVDDLFPGIDIRVAREGHSFAMNMVLIHTPAGKYLYTGDSAYVKGNIIGGRGDGVSMPNGYAIGSTWQTIHTMQDILKILDGDVDRALICHEVGTWEQYPSKLTEDGLHIAYVQR